MLTPNDSALGRTRPLRCPSLLLATPTPSAMSPITTSPTLTAILCRLRRSITANTTCAGAARHRSAGEDGPTSVERRDSARHGTSRRRGARRRPLWLSGGPSLAAREELGEPAMVSQPGPRRSGILERDAARRRRRRNGPSGRAASSFVGVRTRRPRGGEETADHRRDEQDGREDEQCVEQRQRITVSDVRPFRHRLRVPPERGRPQPERLSLRRRLTGQVSSGSRAITRSTSTAWPSRVSS